MLDRLAVECAASLLQASRDYRLLRRVDLDPRAGCANDNAGLGDKIAIVLDTETTGLDPAKADLLELSLRRLRFNDAGVITQIGQPYSWLEDPGRPLDPAIVQLTGLTDAMIAGQRLDEDFAASLLQSATVVIAFNAAFDRRVVERRLPQARGLAWACAMREIDWQRRGFDGAGRSLGYLLAQAGWFNDRSHRAGGDVDATIAILEQRDVRGETALFELLETASQRTWRIAAVGANFLVKDSLRGRGYRWDPEDHVWWREVPDEQRDAEEDWLAGAVYALECQPRMDRPSIREVDWYQRHG